MSHYKKAKDHFASSLRVLEKQPKKEEWAISLSKGLSELCQAMEKTDDYIRQVAGIVDLIQKTMMSRRSN